MPKKDGYKTREKILQVAEDLFSEFGFNGTSINKIAKAAGVNKGLIYYHFKDKKDIIVSILKSILGEIDQYVNFGEVEEIERDEQDILLQKIRGEIEYCMHRKQIISVMLMESLKNDDKTNFLFQCADLVIQQELDGIKKKMNTTQLEDPEARLRYLVHEFFTGFMPVISFVTMQDKWCEYFGCDREKALDYFLDSFTKTHLTSHMGKD